MSTKKVTSISPQTAQQAASKYISVTNLLAQTEAKMNGRMHEVKSKYHDHIEELKKSQQKCREELELYANEQKSNWDGKRSIEMFGCVIGFKKSPPKVEKPAAFTWEAVTALVRKHFPKLIRRKEELDKDAIKAMRGEEQFKKLQEVCHIDIVQDETFFVEIKQ